MKQNNAKILPPPIDPEQEVRNGNLDIVLIIPETYGRDFSDGRSATLKLVYDSSRQSSIPAIEHTRTLIFAYEKQISHLHLLARGINPGVVDTIALENIDVATPQSQVLIFLNMMPYFVVLVVFVGGMYVIIDTTAGERERGSLEPLLITPVPRWCIVLGKLSSALPFAVIAVFLTLATFAVAFNFLPLEDYIGIQVTINVLALGMIFLIALPMILMASALQMVVATFTRSFKEAQTYVAFLPLIPALPGIGLAFLPVKPTIWIMMIPTFGQQLLINQIMRGEPVVPSFVIVNTLSTIGAAFILTLVAIKLYGREQILFGPR